MARKQVALFTKLDKFEFDDACLHSSDGTRKQHGTWAARLDACVAAFPEELAQHAPKSHTVVLEAVAFMIRSGLLNVKGTCNANIKQARALLGFGLWLQSHMSTEWVADGTLTEPPWSLGEQFFHVLIGGAGTGKTSTVRVMEALIDYFCGPDSMRKAAPTNTAARLLGGNTLHALYKLPSHGTIIGRSAHMGSRVLKAYRRSWASVKAQAIDEISMVPPEFLYRIHVRSQLAKRCERFMGDMATILCGDYLQIPPVKSRSLAMPVDARGFDMEADGHDGSGEESSDPAGQKRKDRLEFE
jgi:hypothetical protein